MAIPGKRRSDVRTSARACDGRASLGANATVEDGLPCNHKRGADTVLCGEAPAAAHSGQSRGDAAAGAEEGEEEEERRTLRAGVRVTQRPSGRGSRAAARSSRRLLVSTAQRGHMSASMGNTSNGIELSGGEHQKLCDCACEYRRRSATGLPSVSAPPPPRRRARGGQPATPQTLRAGPRALLHN